VTRAVQVYTDPLQHAAIAGTVAAPLGRAAVRAAIVAALVIDLDHAVAARSLRVRDTTGLDTRPRTHSLVTALAVALLVTRRRGPVQGWAVFGGLVSHFLHDAGDRAAPTPMLWPFAPARQLGRRRQVVFTAALVAVSFAAAAASRRRTSSAWSGSGGGTAPPRTA
jgi:membrane-bound metal-dependent hydrolase YbcI (DUF457 family)